MKVEEFIANFAEVIGASPSEVLISTELASLEGWDSMGQLSTLSLLDEIGVQPPKGALQNCQTVQDLVALAEPKLAR